MTRRTTRIISLDDLRREEFNARLKKVLDRLKIAVGAVIGAYAVIDGITAALLMSGAEGGHYIGWVHWPLRIIFHLM